MNVRQLSDNSKSPDMKDDIIEFDLEDQKLNDAKIGLTDLYESSEEKPDFNNKYIHFVSDV